MAVTTVGLSVAMWEVVTEGGPAAVMVAANLGVAGWAEGEREEAVRAQE